MKKEAKLAMLAALTAFQPVVSNALELGTKQITKMVEVVSIQDATLKYTCEVSAIDREQASYWLNLPEEVVTKMSDRQVSILLATELEEQGIEYKLAYSFNDNADGSDPCTEESL